MSPRAVVGSFNSFFVSSYKVFGFVALSLILFGLVAYVVIQGFYLVNRSWVAPLVLSPTHERVLMLNRQLTEEKYQRSRLLAEKLDLQAELDAIDRRIALAEQFQEGFEKALGAEHDERQRELSRLGALVEDYRRSKKEIQEIHNAYSGLTRERLTQELKAKLIDRDDFVSGNYQISRVEQAKLQMEEKELRLDTQRRRLAREVRALAAARDRVGTGAIGGEGEVTYDVLMKERDYNRSLVEMAYERARRASIQRQLELIDETLARHDRMLETIQNTPYIRAIETRVHVAFVPYENLEEVRPGESIYGCELGLVWCKQVGTVVRILDGETSIRHPLQNRELRGVLAEIELEDPKWGEEMVLHVGHAPFLL